MKRTYKPSELYLCQVIRAHNIVKIDNMTRWKPEFEKYLVCQWPNEIGNDEIGLAVLTQEQFYMSSYAVSNKPGHDVFLKVVKNLSQEYDRELTLEDIGKIEKAANKKFAAERNLEDGLGI